METYPVDKALEWRERIAVFLADRGVALLTALLVLATGLLLARWIGKLVGHSLGRPELRLEAPIQVLAVRAVKLFAVVCTVLIAADTAGVPISTLLAGLGVLGVGLGLATQNVLRNLIAGLAVIANKPFSVGEFVELPEVQGRVLAVELFATTLLAADRARVVVPNHKLIDEVVRNHGKVRQLQLRVGVPRGTDLELALALARQVLEQSRRVLKEPAPRVGLELRPDGAIELAVSPWTSLVNHLPARTELSRALLESFLAHQIGAAIPEQEVHLVGLAREKRLQADAGPDARH